jgi:methylmalonyl-CoA/ethylmalonyl-CoA epimerase
VFRVTDLKIVRVVTLDLEGTITTFRKNFAFPFTRESAEAGNGKTRRAFLGVGPAEIEVVAPSGQDSPLATFVAERGAGLFQLVLEVDDLEAARAGLSERGVEVTLTPGIDGEPSASLNPHQTHGVRIALVPK